MLQLLPSFLALSATQLALEGENQITDLWMQLATEYMAHTVAEQVIAYESEDPTMVDRIFDWKFDETTAADESTDTFLINAMFFDADIEGTNARWIEFRDKRSGEVGQE